MSIKTLAIFDFDGTLFRSPERPDWWPQVGWWSKDESLGPPCVPEKPGSDWWVASTVEAAKKCISNPETFAVLCTGRLAGKFHARLFELLSHVGLRFDEVHLTPGGGTLPFKLKIIEGLLNKLEVEKVEVWEDRSEHVGAFKAIAEQFGKESEIHLVSTKSHALECTPESIADRIVARYAAAKEPLVCPKCRKRVLPERAPSRSYGPASTRAPWKCRHCGRKCCEHMCSEKEVKGHTGWATCKVCEQERGPS